MRAEEAGFTLVEVIVALVASAALLAIISNGAATAGDRQAKAERQREAVLLARTLVAEGAAAAYRSAADSGVEGSLHWRRGEQPIAEDSRGLYVLARIDVEVADHSGTRLAALTARRLKPVQPQ
jgi:prepilin-type N-terminal cleavage/methylation domain-containing protein